MKLLRPLTIAALLATALVPAAQAHNAWLLPSSTVLSKAQWITVDAAVANDLFFFNHNALNLDNLSVTAPDGSKVAPENLAKGKLRSVFDLNLTQAGTYRVAVVNAGIMASFKLKGEPKRWRGSAEAFAREIPAEAEELNVNEMAGRNETFVTVGKPSALTPIGKGLELVPVTHPNDLVNGEAATFQMLLDGKPAAGLEVTVTKGATRYRNQLGEMKLKTGADGKFSVTFPEAGMYWLDAELKDSKTSVKAAKERRVTYAATLEVLPQ
ncbi:DUF4198 domain-containing protein [Azospira sp. APE16]|uniref:DUF4198 domain-containing protein n=1 Tax=unclassified Azospira TaxID=2609269 RepID=UPI0025640DC4|nr:DUF4198 domain-containing protein [Azospira sp.]MDK9690473.1 DUF4198 domain-containing protein [Azospira sp.]